MGTLFVVATPIGNLQDITIRAIKTLFEVDIIACEDTRRAGLLLEHIAPLAASLLSNHTTLQRPSLLSYYEQNEFHRIPEILSLLQQEKNIAVISDAGTPAISDPGFKLIRECLAAGIKVVSVPGPSSAISALISSGLPTDKFTFVGYPPHKSGHRLQFYEHIKSSLESLNTTIIFFEAPHKLVRTLGELQTVFGDIEVVLCRELTKIHEDVRKEKISDALKRFETVNPKGEFVVLFHF